MERRKQEISLQALQIIDGLLLVVAFWLAYVVRLFGEGWIERGLPKFEEFRWLVFLIMPFGPILLELQGFYKNPLGKTLLRTLGQMARAAVGLCLLVAACVIFLKLKVPSRAVLVLFAVFGSLLLLLREQLTVAYMKRKLKGGSFRTPVLLAGTAAEMSQVRGALERDHVAELEVVGEVDIEARPTSDLVEAMHRLNVSRVLIAAGRADLNRVQEVIGACEIEGVEAWLMADFIKTSIARPDFDAVGGRPALVFRTTPEVSWALMVKAVIDRVGAFVLLALASPLLAVAAIGVRLSSPGPIIFRQARAGKHGRPFMMYKFRSMYSDAEMRRDELMRFNQMKGPVFKVADDPRVTPFGKWLRRTSVDELPQLVNVLQGHMSLVGPRPLPLYEVEQFEDVAQRRRLSVKPGLTCLWQVSGRNEVKDFEDWVRLDLAYIDNWSIWLDIKILLRTVPVVLWGFGAR